MEKDIIITFLGSGYAFCLAEENYQSNILITNNEGKHLLYDAGSTIADALNASKINLSDIDSIFISHLHADHIGGLENIALRRYFANFPFGQNPPKLIGTKTLLKKLWKNSLKGGLAYIEGGQKKLNSYFNVQKIESYNNIFEFGSIEIETVKTLHVHEVENQNIESYGLFMTFDKYKVFITGDVQFDQNLKEFYDRADYIFQDCEFAKYPNGIHAQFHELCSLPDKVREKMWLYHYTLKIGENQDSKGFIANDYESFEDRERTVLEAGFAGLVKQGQEFLFPKK